MVLKRTIAVVKQSSLTPVVKADVRCSEVLPWLYRLLKTHKENVPLRPIISAIGSPICTLAKHLTKFLQPSIRLTDSQVRDSVHFLRKLKGLMLDPGNVLISFDVVSLFMMIPLQEVLGYLGDWFPTDITSLFQHGLITTYFQWDDGFCEQTDGVATVCTLSPVITKFCLEKSRTW